MYLYKNICNLYLNILHCPSNCPHILFCTVRTMVVLQSTLLSCVAVPVAGIVYYQWKNRLTSNDFDSLQLRDNTMTSGGPPDQGVEMGRSFASFFRIFNSVCVVSPSPPFLSI